MQVLAASLEDAHFQANGGRPEGEKPLLPRMKMTGWTTVLEVLGLWLDTEDMTVGLPQRKLEDLRQRLANWLPERREEAVREVLSLAGKLHHAAYVVRPGHYFVRRLLWLANLHLTGEIQEGEGTRGEDFVGRQRRRAY